ncbi:MAG: tRNA uridine-5-carboxymethylaminomethyl(34) synthesis GTPase MnmE, partial [Rhodospirillales bacterium]
MTAGDIIFACASGIGRSGVAVIRISGSGSSSVFQALTGSPPPKPRQASVRMLYAKDKELLDKALTIYFPAPRSFTGEVTVELHIHGGPAGINGVLSAL